MCAVQPTDCVRSTRRVSNSQCSIVLNRKTLSVALRCSILRTKSLNTLALSLWSLNSSGASIAGLQLVADGAFSTGLDIADYLEAPDYAAQSNARPLPQVVRPM
jgi:hypothetical protein